MEILKGRKKMTAESLRGMTVMEDHQMTMIQMMMTTMETAEMMTPQVVIAIPYQAAATFKCRPKTRIQAAHSLSQVIELGQNKSQT